MISRLPEDAQTLHAEALALSLALEAERAWSHLPGSFSIKTVAGAEYVYFQYSDPGGTKRQFSVGRRTPELDAVVEQYAAARAEHELDRQPLDRLVGMMRSAGLAVAPHAPARVLRALSEAGVFNAGGVLVGSYAFQTLGNLLGVRWPGAAWRTQDIDNAAHLRIAVPATTADIPKALDSLQMGFVPIPQLDVRQPSTSFRVRGQTLRLDLVTPGRTIDVSPTPISRFRAAAAPIRHLTLVMDDAQPGLVIGANHVHLVVVPTPARFALHKLYVSQTRSVVQQAKSGKDRHQAALMLEVLAEDRPADLAAAAEAFTKPGPTVSRKVLRGLDAARKQWPDIGAAADIIRPILGP